jgi:hypothetical protein
MQKYEGPKNAMPNATLSLGKRLISSPWAILLLFSAVYAVIFDRERDFKDHGYSGVYSFAGQTYLLLIAIVDYNLFSILMSLV